MPKIKNVLLCCAYALWVEVFLFQCPKAAIFLLIKKWEMCMLKGNYKEKTKLSSRKGIGSTAFFRYNK